MVRDLGKLRGSTLSLDQWEQISQALFSKLSKRVSITSKPFLKESIFCDKSDKGFMESYN